MTLNHGFSGYVVGQALLPVLRRYSPVPPAALGAAFFLGAMAPDVDIVTRLLGGRAAYFGDAWYAHRAASHSVVGTLLLGLAVAALLSAWRSAPGAGGEPRIGPGRSRPPSGYFWLAGCAWVGGLLHIVGDLFTPFRPLPLLWPLPDRIGAFSHIGWFSPYLLWLFVTTIALGWTAARLLPGLAGGHRWTPVAVWALYALASYRWIHYLVVSRYESAQQWQAYQEALLPQIMVRPLSVAVRAAWLWLSR
jgi:membrane-bound metal-dependent hydrolase YbcI (DUF457 family)